MAYDASLDQQVFVKLWESDMGKITVSVFSYNNGPRKLQIVREVRSKEGEYSFAKLGRLAKNEIQGILPLIQEAIAQM